MPKPYALMTVAELLSEADVFGFVIFTGDDGDIVVFGDERAEGLLIRELLCRGGEIASDTRAA